MQGFWLKSAKNLAPEQNKNSFEGLIELGFCFVQQTLNKANNFYIIIRKKVDTRTFASVYFHLINIIGRGRRCSYRLPYPSLHRLRIFNDLLSADDSGIGSGGQGIHAAVNRGKSGNGDQRADGEQRNVRQAEQQQHF